MLSVINQTKEKKVSVEEYGYYDKTITGFDANNSYEYLLGRYETKEDAKKVFNAMVKAEEEQNTQWNGGFVNIPRQFQIFRMPSAEEVKEWK